MLQKCRQACPEAGVTSGGGLSQGPLEGPAGPRARKEPEGRRLALSAPTRVTKPEATRLSSGKPGGPAGPPGGAPRTGPEAAREAITWHSAPKRSTPSPTRCTPRPHSHFQRQERLGMENAVHLRTFLLFLVGPITPYIL